MESVAEEEARCRRRVLQMESVADGARCRGREWQIGMLQMKSDVGSVADEECCRGVLPFLCP